jgi:hypothetical protein
MVGPAMDINFSVKLSEPGLCLKNLGSPQKNMHFSVFSSLQ